MILSDIKRYLIQRQRASLGEIAFHFDAEPTAVQGMLEQWIRKGKVAKTTASGGCGSSCGKCDSTVSEVYEWIGPDGKAEEHSLPFPTRRAP